METSATEIFLWVYGIGITFALGMLLWVSACRIQKEIGKRFDNEPSWSETESIAGFAKTRLADDRQPLSVMTVCLALNSLHALKWPEGKPRMNEVYGKEG